MAHALLKIGMVLVQDNQRLTRHRKHEFTVGSFNSRHRGVAIPVLILVVLLVGGLWSAGKIVSPWARNRALGAIQRYFGGQAKFGTLRLAFHPESVVSGTDLRIELPGAGGVPPLVSIQRFSASVGFIGLLRRPLHLRSVHLEGLLITFLAEKRRPKDIPGRTVCLLSS